MIIKLGDYLKQVLEEFKKIKYPERKEVVAMSIGIVIAIFIIGLFCLSIDWVFVTFINFAILS